MKTFCLIISMMFLNHGYSIELIKKVLDKNQAIQLAVTLANKECRAQFGVAPFDANSYEIIYNQGHWNWGVFDPSGINGYSVTVKFDRYGKNAKAEVYLSVDAESQIREE